MKHHKELITSRMVVKSKPPVATSCFQYLKDCKHDMKSGTGCPLCKLINNVTKIHFLQEKEQSQREREESIVNRALLRLTLLRRWSRCQSSLYNKHIQSCSFDIVLSRTAAEVLALNEGIRNADFPELSKILARRNRMKEVGLDAIVFLQARIRAFLAKCSVRRLLLRRMEWVEGGRTKPGYWYDKKTLRRLNRPPRLLIKLQATVLVQPVTPRTVERRLAAEQRRADKRLVQYNKLLNDAAKGTTKNILEVEDFKMSLLTELSVLRDLVLVAMASIARCPRVDEDNKERKGEVDTAKVWVSVSAPASSCRSIGLSIALETTPSPVAASAGTGNPNSTGNTSNPNSTLNTGSKSSTTTDDKLLQRYLKALEDGAWRSLSCSSPEDVLRIMLSADLQPTFESVLNITQDDKAIWSGQLGHLPASLLSITGNGGQTNSSKSTNDARSAHHNAYQHEVLPLCLQLHLLDPQLQPSGLFRLFYYREDLIAVSACSPWVFYPEVYAIKDDILSSIREYASRGTTTAFIKQLLLRANTRSIGTTSSQLYSTSFSKQRATAPFEHLLQSLFLPPSELVYNPTTAEVRESVCPEMDLNKLSDERVLYFAEHYRFLRKKPGFSNRYNRANNNRKKRRQKMGDAEQQKADRGSTAAKSNSDDFRLWSEDVRNEPYLNPAILRDADVTTAVIAKDADRNLLSDLHSIQQSKGFIGSIIRPFLKGLDSSKETEEPTQLLDGLTEYPARLHRYCSRIVTTIDDRINIPDGIDVMIEGFPLVVMDVNVHLPERGSSSMMNRMSSEKKQNLSVSLHHVLGAFPCETERPPPNLDCSLIDWHYILGIHSMRRTFDAIDAESHYKVGRKTIKKSTVGTAQSASSGYPTQSTGHWNSIDSITGVSTYRIAAGTGKEFQLCILGAPPSRRHLEEVLPPKVKEWLGL